jgi:hypothetical protein
MQWKKRVERLMKRAVEDPAYIVFLLAKLVFGVGIALLIWFGVPYLVGLGRGDGGRSGGDVSVGGGRANRACAYRRAFDGMCVENAEAVNPRLAAVMVENSFEAWPLSGVAAASVVYEAPVEADIPRFLLIFPSDSTVSAVGPVRSARPYYLDWVAEYGVPMYIHVGGSSEALSLIDDRGIFDINEMRRGWYFWRDEDRPAPHNAYTSGKLWRSALDKYGADYAASTTAPWAFDDRTACLADCADRVDIRFSNGGYSVAWKYNATTDRYDRYGQSDAAPDRDADGAVVSADTVIVERVRASVIDAVGRKAVDTLGAGEATGFRSGYAIAGRWSKADRESRTRFTDADGREIPLKAGTIWIEIVPQYGEMRFATTTL